MKFELFIASGGYEDAKIALQNYKDISGDSGEASLLTTRLSIALGDFSSAIKTAQTAQELSTDHKVTEALAIAGAAAYLEDFAASDHSGTPTTPIFGSEYGTPSLLISCISGNLTNLNSEDQFQLFRIDWNTHVPGTVPNVQGISTVAAQYLAGLRILTVDRTNTTVMLNRDPSLKALAEKAELTMFNPTVSHSIDLEHSGFPQLAADLLGWAQSWTFTDDQHSYTFGERANLLIDAGDYSSALDDYARALDITDTSFRRLGKTKAHILFGQFENALNEAALITTTAEVDESARISFLIASTVLADGPGSADGLLSNAIAASSLDAQLITVLVDKMAGNGMLEPARILATEILLWVEDIRLLSVRATLNHALNEVDAAFADADRAIELDRSDFNGWFARGALHASDGRFDKAQSDLLIAQNLVTADDLKYASIIEQILAFIEEAISSNG